MAISSRGEAMKPALLVALALSFLPAASPSVEARVVRLVVERTEPFAGGKPFGSAGPFERVEGTVNIEVDPRDPLNAVIVNLDRAPRNARGRVEFSAPFIIIKPVDMAKGNQKILYGVNNRGNSIEIDLHSYPAIGTGTPLDRGDGLLFALGYTFVDAGWAGDIVTTRARPDAEGRLGANLPIAVAKDGAPIASRIRIEYSGSGFSLPIKGNRLFQGYEAASLDQATATLTVRDSMDGRRQTVARDRWGFGSCPAGQGSFTPSPAALCLFDGFSPDRIYELTYQAKGPWVMGLGYAVTRDLASFLRHATHDDDGQRNPLARDARTVGIRRVYGTGTSSTGMYMRDFLYLGFNEDEARRKVFDAVRIAIPGTHRLFANVEFADPNVYSRQDQHADFLSYSYPPLTYAVTTDPISGKRDGILKRPRTDPLVIHVDTANEFWQMNASLNVHDGRGEPVPVPDTVRLYMLSNHSHTGASGVAALPTARAGCAHIVNSNRSSRTGVMRALLVALDEWADRGIAPPMSRYPDVREGTLVPIEEAARAFPRVPGVTFPTTINALHLLDYGPRFTSTGGWLTTLPPERRGTYQVRVPRPDADGIDTGGIKTVDIVAPVGTNLAWNLRAEGPRGRDLCNLSGSFVPLAKTRADRLASNDPRSSLEERYVNHAGFVAAVDKAAQALVSERLLLAADAKTMVAEAEASGILK
jgi:hypothetical protein